MTAVFAHSGIDDADQPSTVTPPVPDVDTRRPTGVLDRFAHMARTAPDRVAVTDGLHSMTYQQLADSAALLAEHLREQHDVQAGDIVVAHLNPGPDAVVALLSILAAGACYVAIATDTPQPRLMSILEDAQPKIVLTHSRNGESGQQRPPYVVADARIWQQSRDGSDAGFRHVGPDALCYMVYTSGTTGRPKGVPVTHANLDALITAALQVCDLRQDDRWLQFHTMAFDFSVWEVWGCLSTGGTLVVADSRTRLDPELTAEVIERERISILSQTPTAFAALSQHLHTRDVSNLRYVVFGGEALTSSVLRAWAQNHDVRNPVLLNMYGITECTVHLTCHRITDEDLHLPTVPIGKPLPGFEATLVDGEGRTDATYGVLHVRGPQVVHGYWNRPEETARRFDRVVDESVARYFSTGDLCRIEDGVLHYISRVDQQVQLNGFRVEITEVHDAALAIPFVAQCKVLPITPSDGIGTALALVYTTVDQRRRHIRDVRRHLLQTLPRYMLPQTIVYRPTMPLTTNGKLDESTLRKEIIHHEY
ncbi:amino acid adenylation domain-containing protein [Mycobacterium hackensackense]|uniref:amino acid adenylation domain-containing protein n=1 Tax=Mycobacterium hackensackense TaxID=228909 RepID=UPI002265E7BE|nr:amino acid adenylation domain-containing protein [Mycobacterium hackensackense]MCV7256869.1 amino acid adenylation domain-containing protein [Mycobacterium hackensackense]